MVILFAIDGFRDRQPDWLEPMAATLTQERFSGGDWLFERKFDGIRLLADKRHGVRVDAVQMPINPLDWHFRSFQRRVVPELVKDDIAVLGMKPLADGHALKSGAVTAVECLHYALSMPTSVVITGCERMEILDQAIEAARTFRPLSEQALADIRSRSAKVAAEGRYEPFKVTHQYDGTFQNPQWLG